MSHGASRTSAPFSTYSDAGKSAHPAVLFHVGVKSFDRDATITADGSVVFDNGLNDAAVILGQKFSGMIANVAEPLDNDSLSP